MANIKSSVSIKSDYGSHKYITFPEIGRQRIDYDVDIPDGMDEKKFTAAFSSALNKEIENEEKSAASIEKQLSSWSSQIGAGKIPYDDMVAMVEQINASIVRREDGMKEKWDKVIENVVLPAAQKGYSAALVKQVKIKVVAKIIGYTVIGLAAAAASVAAVVLTGGVALAVVIPAAIKGAVVLKGAGGKALEAYKTLGTTYRGLNDKIQAMSDAANALSGMLPTHKAQIDVEEAALDKMKIECGRLDGEARNLSTIKDRPDLVKLAEESATARDELKADIATAEAALTKHKDTVAAIEKAVNVAALNALAKDLSTTWATTSKVLDNIAKSVPFETVLKALEKIGAAA